MAFTAEQGVKIMARCTPLVDQDGPRPTKSEKKSWRNQMGLRFRAMARAIGQAHIRKSACVQKMLHPCANEPATALATGAVVAPRGKVMPRLAAAPANDDDEQGGAALTRRSRRRRTSRAMTALKSRARRRATRTMSARTTTRTWHWSR